MNIFVSWIKNTLISIITSTLMILLFKYVLKIEVSILRMVLVYIVVAVFQNILWLIKRKNINFSKIKSSIMIGIFGWGLVVATVMNLFINNPFELYYAIIHYIAFMVGGGIIMYSLTKKIMKRKWKVLV